MTTRDPACCGTCAAIVSALTPEQPVKAPGQDENSQRPSEPVLPRRIEPEDVRVGMVIERRNGECYVGGRVKSIDAQFIETDMSGVVWDFGGKFDGYGWSLWLIEDAPAPEDPDAKAIEVMARVTHDQNCCKEWDDHGNGVREVWREAARDALDTLWDEGYRIEANTTSQDTPDQVDPDAELVERMAEAMWRIEEKPPTDYAGAVDDPEGWQELAEAALLALRETHDVTPRAEQ